MRVEVLGCSGGISKGHDSTCLLVGETVLVDAGSGARKLDCQESLKIKNILVSHSHLDHIASICFIADQDIENPKASTLLHCTTETASALRQFLVNQILWPEIEKVVINGVQMIEFNLIRPFEKFSADGYEFTPLPVHHAVPTVGFCLHGKEHELIFFSDIISADQEVWDWIKGRDKLKYFVIESAFPNSMEEIAHISKHLTPGMLKELCSPLRPDIEIYATHIKPVYYDTIVKELSELKDFREVKVLKEGDVFKL